MQHTLSNPEIKVCTNPKCVAIAALLNRLALAFRIEQKP